MLLSDYITISWTLVSSYRYMGFQLKYLLHITAFTLAKEIKGLIPSYMIMPKDYISLPFSCFTMPSSTSKCVETISLYSHVLSHCMTALCLALTCTFFHLGLIFRILSWQEIDSRVSSTGLCAPPFALFSFKFHSNYISFEAAALLLAPERIKC